MAIDRALVAWVALGVIWGSNFIFMKWATEFITPSQVVLVRVAMGFVPVLIYALVKGQLQLVQLKHSLHFFAMACLAAAVYYYGFAKGTSLLPSGIAGAVSGAIPIFSLIAAVIILPGENLTRSKAAGLIVGFLGVVAIARPFGAGLSSAASEGVLYMVAGSMSLGISFVYARKFITPLGMGRSSVFL